MGGCLKTKETKVTANKKNCTTWTRLPSQIHWRFPPKQHRKGAEDKRPTALALQNDQANRRGFLGNV